MTIIIAILTFGIMILVHELGHFLTAKWAGVKVNEFAIGMGPTILKVGKGETRYALRLFPIGGFVSMEGEDEESDDHRSFNRAAWWKRAVIIVAGAFMNILLGFVVSVILTCMSDRIASTTIAVFDENALSSQQLQVDDKIVAIDGFKVNVDMDLLFAMALNEHGVADVDVIRDGEKLSLANVQFPAYTDESTGRQSLSLDFYVYGMEKSFGRVMYQSAFRTGSIVKIVWVSIYQLVSGQFSLNDLSGPIGVTSEISSTVNNAIQTRDITPYLLLLCAFTINIGIMNLLPVPALDGGRLLFLIIEKIRGKRIDPKYEAYVNAAGLVLLLVLMAVVAVNDVGKLIGISG